LYSYAPLCCMNGGMRLANGRDRFSGDSTLAG